jgi:putative thioredoxin
MPMDPSGVPDLSTLSTAPAAGAAPGRYEIVLTEQNANQVVQGSASVPVVVLLTSADAPDGGQLVADLRTVVDEQEGRLQLAVVDVASRPQLAQAFQVKQIPSALVLLAGQVMDLFAGVASAEQLRPVMAQITQLALQQGLTGRAQPTAAAAGDTDPAEDAASPVPPHLQPALEALQRNDLPAALAVYDEALSRNPRDEEAQIGKSSVELMQRTDGVDLAAVRETGASRPEDLDAQLAVADVDMLGGHVEDAFDRLLQVVRTAAEPEDRDRARARLLEFYGMVGADDPRVAASRKRLATALYR